MIHIIILNKVNASSLNKWIAPSMIESDSISQPTLHCRRHLSLLCILCFRLYTDVFYEVMKDICSKESISTSDQKISQSYAINLPHQLILFVNTQSYRLFLKYLSVTFPLHSTASKILSSPIDLPTIKINNCTIQHNTLFNFFPFPNLAIYTVIFKTKVPHNVILKSTSVFKLQG
ncbi:hypothetical protein YC2023_019347 [Brassica napus]